MGDRSNIAIIQSDRTRVWLYGHWMGSTSLTHAVVGLRSGRSNDDAYLARIIFSSMVSGDIDGETGFGISTYATDNEYPVVVISPNDQTVWLESGKESTPAVGYTRFIDLFAEVGEDLDAMLKRLNSEP